MSNSRGPRPSAQDLDGVREQIMGEKYKHVA